MGDSEIDTSCKICDGNLSFKLTKIEGHQTQHTVGTCNKCGFSEVVSPCRCKVEYS